MKYYPGWASHQPILIKVMEMTSGPVLELGIGPNSTPLLHWLCYVSGRKLVSYESDRGWFDQHKHFHRPHHELHFVEDWDNINIDGPWSLAFIDHKPASRRRKEVYRLVNNSQFVVVHDTQPEDNHFYRHERAFARFKYRFNYTKNKPHTSVLSNFVDVEKVLGEL